MYYCASCDNIVSDRSCGHMGLVKIKKHKMGNELFTNKEHKMTREEAYKLLPIMEQSCIRDHFLNALESLGLLKFEEKKNVSVIFTSNYQDIRLEEWPEGLVLWVGGEVVWKSWEKYYKKGDRVNLTNIIPNEMTGVIK